MQDFTQIGNQPNDDFHNTEAAKTLDTVFNEWQSGKQVVEWTVLQAVSPQELANRMKMLKMGLYSSPVLVVIATFFMLKFVLDFDKQTSMIFIAAMALFIIIDVFLAIPLTLKAATKNLHNPITVKIDRNKKLAVITHQQQSKKVKYGSQGVLPAFRLPENNRSQYAEKRSTLQQQITAETGFLFEETV
ncbi:MAG: hypothetical protein IJV56_07885 [Neisseriaceae bacterium]|nr:hypothetical protein [Neisseriaceae bacterium]